MKFSYQQVPIKEIDFEYEFFHYTDSRYDEPGLLESIRINGIINSPTLFKKGQGFAPVSGFRRIKAAKKVGLKRIPAQIVEDLTLEEGFKLSILENELNRKLNLFEKANALFCLKKAGISAEQIVQTFMPLMGIHPSVKIKNDLLAILKLPQPLVDYIIEKNLPLKRISHLRDLDILDYAIFSEMVEVLTWGASLFEEITKGLVEIAGRDDKKVKEVVESLGVLKILKDKILTKTERAERIRELVLSERYPTLFKKNQKIEDIIKRLDPPSFFKVDWDRTLEERDIILKLHIEDESKIEEVCEFIKRTEVIKTIREVWKEL